MKKQKVLFLGYSADQNNLISYVKGLNTQVTNLQSPVADLSEYDTVISYGYRHILKPEVLGTSKRPVINLHIAYLPYNKGAHPNFWSFFDNTPAGVTIHEIDAGIDTGSIIFQKYVNFDRTENTFALTYKRLISEIEKLFIENVDALLNGTYTALPQRGKGTYHSARDLPPEVNNWDEDIEAVIAKLDMLNQNKKF